MEIDVPAEHTFLDCGIREVSLDGCRYEVDLSPIGYGARASRPAGAG